MVDKLNTYTVAGIPEALATTFILVWLSLSLAPWVGGTEVGPLKVPRLPKSTNRWLRVIAPLGLLISALGFIKVWPSTPSTPHLVTYDEYVASFFDTSKKENLKEGLFVLNELETRQLGQFFAQSIWDHQKPWF